MSTAAQRQCLSASERWAALVLTALCLVTQPGCGALSALRTKGALRQLNGT
jgi:hypothetical protein